MSTSLLPSVGAFAYLADRKPSMGVRLGQWLVVRIQAMLPAAVSRQVIAQQEAQALRQVARGLFRDTPSFANDLAAAADRHEVINGIQ